MEFSITLAIIVVTSLVSWLGFNNEALRSALILWPPAVTRRHEYHRFLGYGVVHADFVHLLFNMFTLYFFGRLMEGFYAQYLGAMGFLWFYLSALVVSALPSYLKHRHDPDYATLGASGAVSAILTFAADTARARSLESTDWSTLEQARHAIERACSWVTNISTILCCSAWKAPIGTPNCLRVFRYSSVVSQANFIAPTASAHESAAPKSRTSSTAFASSASTFSSRISAAARSSTVR